jgi:hypothetical protein
LKGWGPISVDHISGPLSGWCGSAYGSGQRDDGEPVKVVWTGTALQVVGAATGTLHLDPSDVCVDPRSTTRWYGVLSEGSGFLVGAGACAGTGIMQTSGFPGSSSASFFVSLGNGGCAPSSGPLSAGGTMWGTCYNAEGTGTANGQPFSVIWQQNTMILIGEAIGEINVFPALGTSGCGHFLANGAVALQSEVPLP